MAYHVEIVRPDGGTERHPLVGRLVIGRRPQDGVAVPAATELEPEHVLVVAHHDGCWLSVVEGARAPVQSFAGDTLPQINRLSQDIRGLVQNMDELVSTLRRNPAQLLSGPRTPEFRR